MKVAALKSTDPWFARMQRALAAGHVQASALEDVAVTNTVAVDTAVLEYDGPERGHRPWLRISGVLVSSRPESALPYGVEELTFPAASTQMDYRYDFTGEQIERLREHKGLYAGQAEISPEATGIEWELLGRMDLLMVAPQTMDDPVAVFTHLHDQSGAAIDWDSSGYELVEYFIERGEHSLDVEQARSLAAARERSDEIDDLFAHEPLDLEQALHEQGVERMSEATQALVLEDLDDELDEMDGLRAQAVGSGGRFEQVLESAEARRAEQTQRMREQLRAMDPDGPSSLYEELMLPLLSESAEPVPDLAHDADQDPEQARRAAARRQQVIDEARAEERAASHQSSEDLDFDGLE